MNEKEKRNDYRYPLPGVSGSISIRDIYSEITVLNISISGAEIKTEIELPYEDPADIRINLKEGIVISAAAKVVWKVGKQPDCAAGIKFIDISPDEVSGLLNQAGIVKTLQALPNPHIEMYENVFENYQDEIFLRRAKEFADYIAENEPGREQWALDLYNNMKKIIESTKKEYETWARSSEN